MRLELTAPLDLNLEADGEERRIVGGLAVPWNVTARLSNGRRARFLPGSIDATPARAPLLCRSHDRRRPFGVVFDATASDAGIYARARISRTPDGDEALTLAADRVLRGLSVGVEAIDFHEETDDAGPDDPVIVVASARWDELSLCPWAAFDEAAVDYVAAAAPEPPPHHPDLEVPPVSDLDAAPAPAVLQAAPPPPLTPSGSGGAPTLYGVAREIVEAARAAGPTRTIEAAGGVVARYNERLVLNAALTDVTTPSGTSGVIGLIRPSYENEVVGLIEYGAPVVAAFTQGNLDSNPVTYPKWTTLPTIAAQATQKTQIGTGNVRIDPATATVATHAGGNDVAMQVIDWSSPDFIAEYFRAATEMYAREIDAVMLAMVVAGATAVERAQDDIAGDLGTAIGAVAATGLPPDRIIVSGDVFGELWGTNVGIVSGGVSQVLNIDLPVPRVVLAPLADAGTFLVTSSRVAKSWQNRGAPVQLRAVDVALLGVNLGVYGYFASAIVNGPATSNPAIQSLTPYTP